MPVKNSVTDGIVGFLTGDLGWLTWSNVGLFSLVFAIALMLAYRRQIQAMISFNWQLALLGATSLVLSLASGYTTWDGMRNFTGEAVLSLMVTFGIQGVMLIVAWLIGESFAAGMHQKGRGHAASSRIGAAVGMLMGVALMSALLIWLLRNTEAGLQWTSWLPEFRNASAASDVILYFALGMLVLGVLLAHRKGDLAFNYVQSARVIIKNAVLWIMFLACMATSVFFSFDSLFTAIFPKEERARAAELRAQNQIAGIIADIGGTISTKRIAEAEALFTHKGWQAYDDNLTRLLRVSQGAEKEIEGYYNQQMELRRQAIAQQQERKTTAESGQAGLVVKKAALIDELNRLKGERPTLAGDLSEKKTELDNRQKAIDAKRVEAMAEDKGVEGTGKVGKGPVYRERMAELGKMQEYVKIQDDRVRDAQKRLSAADARIAQLERELAAIDGDIAKLKGEATTAESRIKIAEESRTGEEGAIRVDPARVRSAFDAARNEFRQDPTAERLARVQQMCSQLYGAMASTEATKTRVRDIDCDPKQASEAAGSLFALNAGVAAFGARCAGGDKLAQHKTADQLFEFSRKCLADSGLPSRETDQLRGKINFIELSRDDKAHRFVVTWNAFNDGNRLAYLALLIAIAIDSLVFMSGLFGAQAVKSPLTEVPSSVGRSPRLLEEIIDGALRNTRFPAGTIRAILSQSHPSLVDGYSEIRLDQTDEYAADVRTVLVTASTVDAVQRVEGSNSHYLIHHALIQYLNMAANTKWPLPKEAADRSEIQELIRTSLYPDVQGGASLVLQHLHAIPERHGFMAEVELGKVPEEGGARDLVRNVMNAGVAMRVAQRVVMEKEATGLALLGRRSASPPDIGGIAYYVHSDLFKTLLRLQSTASAGAIAAASPHGIRQGGALGESRLGLPDLSAGSATRQLQGPAAQRAAAQHDDRPNIVRKMAEGQAAGGQRTGTPAGTPQDQFDYFAARMVEAIGIEPHQYLDIQGDVFSAATAASEAFKAVQQSNRILAQLIAEREHKAQGTLYQVYEQLLSRHRNDEPSVRTELDGAYDVVSRNLPIIALLPGGPIERLLSTLVEKLEPQSGAGKLSMEEGELLRLVRHLRELLVQNDRKSSDSWARLAGLLGQPQVIVAHTAPRRNR